jgi:hypothetical protein
MGFSARSQTRLSKLLHFRGRTRKATGRAYGPFVANLLVFPPPTAMTIPAETSASPSMTDVPVNLEQFEEPETIVSSSQSSEPHSPAKRQNTGLDPNSPWAKQNVLTFGMQSKLIGLSLWLSLSRALTQMSLTLDGGGIRGYYSLLHLEKLMEWCKTIELEMDRVENVTHESGLGSSFAPCGEPRNVSHMPTYTHYLPCHYFDYIGGTSTGA